MPKINILDILGGVGGGSGGSGGSSGSSSGSSVGNLLSGAANLAFPGLGGILSKILGGLSCIGSQAFKKQDYEMRVADCRDIVDQIALYPESLSIVQGKLNRLLYIIHRDLTVLGKLKSSCSKQWCQKTIDYCRAVENQLMPYYVTTRYFKKEQDSGGFEVTVQYCNVVGYKGGINANSNPISQNPATTVPTTYPPATTVPTTYPPATTVPTTYPPSTTVPTIGIPPTSAPVFSEPVIVKDPSGNSTTYMPDTTSGTTVVSTYNPNNGSTATSTVPTSSLNIGGYYDEYGNWQITIGKNKENYTPYILGAVGLLGLLLISKKR